MYFKKYIKIVNEKFSFIHEIYEFINNDLELHNDKILDITKMFTKNEIILYMHIQTSEVY